MMLQKNFGVLLTFYRVEKETAITNLIVIAVLSIFLLVLVLL